MTLVDHDDLHAGDAAALRRVLAARPRAFPVAISRAVPTVGREISITTIAAYDGSGLFPSDHAAACPAPTLCWQTPGGSLAS